MRLNQSVDHVVAHRSWASLRLFLIAPLRVFLRCIASTSVAVRSRFANRCTRSIAECSSSGYQRKLPQSAFMAAGAEGWGSGGEVGGGGRKEVRNCIYHVQVLVVVDPADRTVRLSRMPQRCSGQHDPRTLRQRRKSNSKGLPACKSYGTGLLAKVDSTTTEQSASPTLY